MRRSTPFANPANSDVAGLLETPNPNRRQLKYQTLHVFLDRTFNSSDITLGGRNDTEFTSNFMDPQVSDKAWDEDSEQMYMYLAGKSGCSLEYHGLSIRTNPLFPCYPHPQLMQPPSSNGYRYVRH